MLKARNIVVLISLLLLVVMPMAGAFAQEGTVADVIAGNADFSTLSSLIDAAGLTETLSGEGPFTVFAPTNEAFAELPQFVVDYLTSHPEELATVLTYHVVPSQMMAADVSAMEDQSTVTSVEGEDLVIGVNEAGVTVDKATITAPDLAASNGVVQGIDLVLVPSIELDPVIPADVSGDIVTAGSSTVGPLSVAMVDQFQSEGYAGNISVDIIGSGAGFERFCSTGETDISNASRPIKDSEIEACGQLTPARTPIEIRVGTDALAVVVNPANDFISDATIEQLNQIFSTAETWADVDPSWPAEPILRFIPGTDSGTFDYFVEAVFEEDEGPILAASNTQLSEDDNVLLEGVANNPYAIGFFGYAYYDQNQDELKILNVEGVEPVAANVDNNTYPLARPLFMYSDAGIISEKPQVGQFISYYLQNVNDLIGEVGYFPANASALNEAKLEIQALLSAGM